MENRKVYIITGPTSVGKSAVALKLAQEVNGEIINCDSVQLYKYMDIGSAKPSEKDMKTVPHYLYSIVEPSCNMTVATYQKLAFAAIDNVLARGKRPIVVGGTGLYLNSIIYDMDFANNSVNEERRRELEEMAEKNGAEYMHTYLSGLDPESAARIHPNNLRKVIRAIEAFELGDGIKPINECAPNTKYDFEFFALNMDREWLYDRINRRVIELIKNGLVQEVQSLAAKGYTIDDPSMKGIGYKEVFACLNGEISQADMVKLIMRNTRHYAKRQITWLKRYDDVKWIEIHKGESLSSIVDRIVNYRGE